MGVWLEEPRFTHGELYVAASRLADPQHHQFIANNSASRNTMNVVHKEIQYTGEVVSTPTEVPLTCSLLNSEQPRGAIDLKRCLAPLHFLNLDVISVTTSRTQSFARKKSLVGIVSLCFPCQNIVIHLLA